MSNVLETAAARIVAGLAILLLPACASLSSNPSSSNLANSCMSAASQQAGTPFRLAAGDRVRVVVYGADQLSGEINVDLSGSIAVPLAGTISATGLTPTELEDRIATKLREQHLIDNPHVSVEVVSTRPFYILGEVEKPGEYPFHAGLNVVSAVATAGGFSYRADKTHVFVQCAGENEEVEVPFAAVAQLHPGDIVRVPERFPF